MTERSGGLGRKPGSGQAGDDRERDDDGHDAARANDDPGQQVWRATVGNALLGIAFGHRIPDSDVGNGAVRRPLTGARR